MNDNKMVATLRKWSVVAKGKDVVHLEGVSKREFLDTTKDIIGRLMVGVINREYICPCCGMKTIVVGVADPKQEDDE